MPDEGGDSLPADQLTAPVSSLDLTQEKPLPDSMQDSGLQSVSVPVDNTSDANQIVNSADMDRVRREKQVPFRSPEHRGPNAIKSDLLASELSDTKKFNLDDKVSEKMPVESVSLGADGKNEVGSKDSEASTQQHQQTSLNASNSKGIGTMVSDRTVNGNLTVEKSIDDQSDGKPSGTRDSTHTSIDLDDATLAHRMWSHLQDKQIDIDDGRRAWVNAYYGVKKQAEELERKKSALEKWRDQLVTLEEQLPIMEKKLEQDAEQLYKRRKEFEDKQREMDHKRREFYNLKQSLVEWARTDDSLYDRMIDRKPPRRSKHGPHHGHGHHSHPMPPSHIQMVGSGNDWASPISTPESPPLDDYSYADPLAHGETDGDNWGSMPGPPKNLLGPMAPGPSGTSKKAKSKSKTTAPPPPPPPPGVGEGKITSGSSTSLASSISVLPPLEDGIPVEGKGKGKLVNVTFGDVTNTETASLDTATKDSSKAEEPPIKGLWKKTDASQSTNTWLEMSSPSEKENSETKPESKVDDKK